MMFFPCVLRCGSFAAIRRGGKGQSSELFGKVVRVTKEHKVANSAAISSALDLDRSLNMPRSCDKTRFNPEGHCWHMVLLHHHCRCMTVCDSVNERYFSMIHHIFDEDSTLPPHRIAQRLQLREAGVSCVGGLRDEALVLQLSEILTSPTLFKKNPLKRKRAEQSSSWRLQQLGAGSDDRAGRRHAGLRDPESLRSFFEASSRNAEDEIKQPFGDC